MALQEAAIAFNFGKSLYGAWAGMDEWSRESQRIDQEIMSMIEGKSDLRIAEQEQVSELLDIGGEQQAVVGSKYDTAFEQINREAEAVASGSNLAYGPGQKMGEQKKSQAVSNYNIETENMMNEMGRNIKGVHMSVDTEIDNMNKTIKLLESRKRHASRMSTDFIGNLMGA